MARFWIRFYLPKYGDSLKLTIAVAYRHKLDRVGTPVAVQQKKMMRHSDISTTFNIYGDVVAMR